MALKQRTVDEILDDALAGTPPVFEETKQICELAVTGHIASERCDALERAIEEKGFFVVDVTTDDDDETNLEIHEVKDDA